MPSVAPETPKTICSDLQSPGTTRVAPRIPSMVLLCSMTFLDPGIESLVQLTENLRLPDLLALFESPWALRSKRKTHVAFLNAELY